MYGTGTGSGMIKKIKKYRVESNTFPTFTWFYLNQVFWDKPAFSAFPVTVQ